MSTKPATRRHLVFGCLMLAMFMVAIEATVVATAMPQIVARLGGFQVYAWVFSAFLLGIVNAFVRPVLILLTLPFTLITFGLFLLVINAGMLELVALFLHGFKVHGFWAALLGALVVSVVGWIGSWFIDGAKRDLRSST